ncbi:MAG: hypothetical protein R3F61_22415 [Myxococcota bacterium]
MADWDRPLTEAEAAWVERCRETARVLYDGVEVPHHSCGIAMASTFGRATPAYQALRRGGLTGLGPCGVALSGRMILGEILGDPDPAGPVTGALRAAMMDYEARLPERLRRSSCNELVQDQGEFGGPQRHAHCTRLASETAALVAETLVRHGVPLPADAS